MADVEALRARLAGLSPEERAELDDVLKGTLGRQALSRSMTDENGKTLSYPRMEPVRFEHFDPSTTEGAINNVMLTAAGMGGPVSTLVGAARAGLGPALKAGAGMLPRIAVGAGIGGALRASPLPVVGGGTFKEGAMLGGAIGAGQGGTGALWKHGKRKKLIEGILNTVMGGADEAVEDVAAPAARTAAKGAGRAAVSVADEGADDVVQALMRGDSQYGPMGREAAEQIAAAISKQAGRGAPKAATDIPRAVAGAKTKAAVSKATGPRVQIGAERVGRGTGKTIEEVRRETGPVLDEALGEASPVLPKNILSNIVDSMRKIPPGEREAYVARATSGKTKAQVENIRRTLEHLGLLVPAGAAAAYADY